IFDAISTGQQYGWVDYCDTLSDFEMMTSPYNLKCDVIPGLALHAMRSDTEAWWELVSAAARHAADIDILHSTVRGYATDRWWFEGGVYGHGYHDEAGITNPHRNGMNPAIMMAGQIGGLYTWAFLSGDTLVLDSALEATENVYWRVTHNDYAAWPGNATAGACAVQTGLQVCNPGECEGWEPADGDYGRTGANAMKAVLGAYQATGDPAYLGLLEKIAAYIDCKDQNSIPISCNRFHFYSMFVRNLGHYALFRQAAGLSDDAAVRRVLSNRMNYMTGTLWDTENQLFRMCYHEEEVDETLNPIHDNWLFSIADAFAVGGLVLDRSELIENYGRKAFEHGAANQFYEGSAISYHSAKEFVNQIGFGHMFLHAHAILGLDP
ncbi:MAG: hypothetical protein GY953_08380, partial [bacterium]|nr:hypothetical protein [bacterium]